MDALHSLPFELADYLWESSLYELLSRRECSIPVGVCPSLTALSTEDYPGKILYLQCSKPSHALVSKSWVSTLSSSETE